ncbi:hypothetical protein LQG66_10875 [Bradyrhizobium ontarionense]|uniref:DUF308 domain-containing protein n=1 Tax=Bradyrhizobium ontarionense TaxID=2898149 RepID=A0ABY3RLE4_9BRAD|nr:hypothetical protein [Bradyrhizobium sp. A19]UFZ08296.1 hypothetical protein LQG66_10875 [Bradyrhizobium sp. A19]
MMSAMLAAGALAVLAGLGAIAYGIPFKEFSVGSTMILSGTISVCSGLILFGLSAVLGELKMLSHRLRPRAGTESDVRPLQLPASHRAELEPPPVPPSEDLWREGGSPRSRPRMPDLSAPLSSTLRNAEPEPAADEPAAEPADRPKRNLLFASTSRRERERADKRSAEAPVPDFRSPPLSEPPPVPLDEPAAAESAPRFGDGWPRPERARTPDPSRPPFPRRFARAAPTFVEPEPAPAAEEPVPDAPAASIIKSGVVDGMAYSLYSDGSIEAQMPEGMMRFASIDQLRTHLEGGPDTRQG